MQKKKRQLPPERVTVEINDLLVKELFLSDPTLRGLDPEKYIQQIPCLNCGRVRHEHAKLKCPFDVTWYRPDPKY